MVFVISSKDCGEREPRASRDPIIASVSCGQSRRQHHVFCDHCIHPNQGAYPDSQLPRNRNYADADQWRPLWRGLCILPYYETSLKFGIDSSRWEIHCNFCMILFPVLLGSIFACSRACNLFIRARVSLATESLRPANKSETAIP